MTSRAQTRVRLQVSSPAFRNEAPIPNRFSCDAAARTQTNTPIFE
jgi:hypothetical protein